MILSTIVGGHLDHDVGEWGDPGCIMACGSIPYVGMTPKNGGNIKSAQMTRSKCLH